jgi:hypothetical protein
MKIAGFGSIVTIGNIKPMIAFFCRMARFITYLTYHSISMKCVPAIGAIIEGDFSVIPASSSILILSYVGRRRGLTSSNVDNGLDNG